MAINPFSMSLLNVGGFQDPLQPKPIGQNIVNVPQLQNQVGQLQAQKNQQLGSMLRFAKTNVFARTRRRKTS